MELRRRIACADVGSSAVVAHRLLVSDTVPLLRSVKKEVAKAGVSWTEIHFQISRCPAFL